MSNRSDVADLLRRAEEQGCTVTLRNNGHLKIMTPERGPVFCSKTPSDRLAIHRIRRDLKHAGVNV